MKPDATRRLEISTIPASAPLAAAIDRLNEAGTGALVLCSPDGRMLGILTDGDIRRAILRKTSLDEPCASVGTRKPVTAPQFVSASDALHLMNRHDIDHLPVVDDSGILQALLLRSDLLAEHDARAVAAARLQSVTVPCTVSIADAMAHLDKAGTGALALCSEERQLVGLLADGDIRRALLNHVSLEESCVSIANKSPVTGRAPISSVDALRIMNEHEIDHLPVLDEEGRIIEFLLRRDLVGEDDLRLSAVIMAGGYGTRLRPLTEHTPKPMLPVGDRPLLERTVQQLRRAGIRDIQLITHYLPDKIADYFGSGEAFGVSLRYAHEEEPFGTAGGLRLMSEPDAPFVVINGDVLTGVSFHDMLLYHRSHSAAMTVGVRKYDVAVPFGVIECDDVRIIRLQEKPTLTFYVNAGVYLLDPSAREHIPEKQRFDMTDLIQTLVSAGSTVVAFPVTEYWLDVGRLEDYQKAQEDVQGGYI